MKLLQDAVLKDRYDVVVVGAGIGGLTAAALLARRGLGVLVLEQHYLPGGCCTAIRRKDIVMDVGAALLYGWNKEDDLHRFVMNELEEEIDMIPHESIYRMHLGGRTVTFWRDMERFLDELTAVFPHQDREIRSLYADCRRIYETMMRLNSAPIPITEVPPLDGLKTFLRDPAGTLKVLRLLAQSGQDVLKRYITDPRVMGFFDFLVAMCTTCTVDECPAAMVLAIFVDNHIGGACYPSGSPQMLPNKLEKAIERYGGRIVYRKIVDEILIWNGRAYGVRLADGTEILAGAVVSNANVWNLYGKLVRPRHIPARRLAWAQSMVPTPSIVMIYLGVRAEAVPEGSRPIEFLVDNVNSLMGDNFVVFIPSLDDPSIAPPGTHSMTIMGPCRTAWPRPDDRFYQSEAYYRLKETEAGRMLETLERRLFPNLRENILTMDVGTPSTLERYTLKVHGNIGGPKLTMKQGFFNRLRSRSEWENLYCAGDSTTMGEGVLPTTISGVGAANSLLRDRGLPPYRARSFPRQYVSMVKGNPWTASPDPSAPITEATARRAARDCQHCQTPGCAKACPAGIDVCYFARRIEAGNFAGAARVLRETNPFSEVCGAVCPAERFCQKACNRLEFDRRPVRIRELHGWVCGHVPPAEGWDRSVPGPNGRTVCVVGAGPAGLTCGHYLARLGYRVEILEKTNRAGGMLAHAVPAARLPDALLAREIQGMTLPGMHVRYGEALGRDVSLDEIRARADAVFLAPGLWAGRELDIGGIDGAPAVEALAFLQECRTRREAALGREVIVVGGGSVAADAAGSARRLGAEKVTLVCLESLEQMPCLASEREELEALGVEVLPGWGPTAVLEASRLCLSACVSVFDADGRFAPVLDPGRTVERAFDRLIVAVGQTAEPALARCLRKELGFDGRLEVDPDSREVPGHPGVFAGGDIVRGAGTVVEAVADGRAAARGIHARLQGKGFQPVNLEPENGRGRLAGRVLRRVSAAAR